MDERSYPSAGLTDDAAKLVMQKARVNALSGISRGPKGGAPPQFQVRFSLHKKQEVLFSSYCLPASALMRDLFISLFTRYPHCVAPRYANFKPDEEDARFNLPLFIREQYACYTPDGPNNFAAGQPISDVLDFLANVEDFLLAKGILYPAPLKSEEAIPALVVFPRKRQASQLAQVLERIQTFGESVSRIDEQRARLFDWANERDDEIQKISQQINFNTAQLQSLGVAVAELTATFRNLIDSAKNYEQQQYERQQRKAPEQPIGRKSGGERHTIPGPPGESEDRTAGACATR